MKPLRFAAPLLSFALFATPATLQLHAASPATPALTQDQNWDGPPNFSDVGHRGWRDGMQAAHADWDARRPLDPYHNPMFRRPPAPWSARQEYRNAFLRGYDAATHQVRGWGYHDNNGWHDEHDNWRDNHENWDNRSR